MSDALVKVLPYCVDLDNTIEPTELHTLFVMNDSEAHRFELKILRGGERQAIDDSFTVTGWYLSHSGKATVKIEGTTKDGRAVVTLKKSCYTYKGQFSLIIQIGKDDIETALFYGNGFMRASRTETVIYDDFIVMDINTLLSQIDDMKKATSDANAAVESANAATVNANAAAKRANDEATAAQGWADATATAVTLESGQNADVNLSTASGGAKLLEFSIPRGEPGVYIGTEEPTDPTVQVWIDPDGEADELPSGVTPDEIQAAVDSYLDEHPVSSGATAEQAAQIQANTEAIAQLQQGGTGSPGSDGNDGEDGFSPTVQIAEITGGHSVSITDVEGTKTFDVMDGKDGKDGATGATGPAGADGADGHTPVKGTDYWTEADKQEIISGVLAALPNASGVSF